MLEAVQPPAFESSMIHSSYSPMPAEPKTPLLTSSDCSFPVCDTSSGTVAARASRMSCHSSGHSGSALDQSTSGENCPTNSCRTSGGHQSARKRMPNGRYIVLGRCISNVAEYFPHKPSKSSINYFYTRKCCYRCVRVYVLRPLYKNLFLPNQTNRILFVFVSFDVDESGQPNRHLLDSSGGANASGLTLQNMPARRESFLYRSDSEYEISPKSASRHSSIGSGES